MITEASSTDQPGLPASVRRRPAQTESNSITLIRNPQDQQAMHAIPSLDIISSIDILLARLA
jgi:hypothetical protein